MATMRKYLNKRLAKSARFGDLAEPVFSLPRRRASTELLAGSLFGGRNLPRLMLPDFIPKSNPKANDSQALPGAAANGAVECSNVEEFCLSMSAIG